jgi:ABC-type multidrug transport system ATPase subunit
MLVNANHIKLTLNGRAILQDVSVHIERGEIYGLLGPNGAGKSTSIAVLLGLYEPDDGDVRLFDETYGDPLALRRRIGVMPEHAGACSSRSPIYCTWWVWATAAGGPSAGSRAACSSASPWRGRWSTARSC